MQGENITPSGLGGGDTRVLHNLWDVMVAQHCSTLHHCAKIDDLWKLQLW